eukprot:TRINITY_DN1562_c0_g1_i1.p1 TRINITY_DN1562_c0_g1~~TRINITY_DN1562_c0_g1_i1.p1  ORF type:complete len:180 (-),score=40.08 TRINITY_DN1562_c0_g1_i1:461-1000(-)
MFRIGTPMHNIRDGIFLGSYAAYDDCELLKKHGVTHVLTVAAHFPPRYPDDFVYKQVSIMDEESADLLSHLPACIEYIRGALESGGKVLVHCAAGVSRSATVVIAYLMVNEGMSVTEARDAVKLKRPIIWPNPGFMRQLGLFEQMGRQVDREHALFVAYLAELGKEQQRVADVRIGWIG